MAYKIIYNKRYLNNIKKLIAYLRLEWSETVAIDVIRTINGRISQISQNPYLGSLQGLQRFEALSLQNIIDYTIGSNGIL